MSVMYDHCKRRYNRRANWKGSFKSSKDIIAVLEDHGVILKRLYKWQKGERHRQLRTLVNKKLLKAEKTYVIFTTGHVQLVQRNRVYDQSGPAQEIEEYWAKGKYVKEIYEVV